MLVRIVDIIKIIKPETTKSLTGKSLVFIELINWILKLFLSTKYKVIFEDLD